MALGIASDATPGAGLVTAVSAGFVVSALGGSRVAIGGPTAAFIPIVVGVAHDYGAAALGTCTVMAGCMLMGLGALRLGTLVTQIPKPLISGFTAGIAVFIFSTQAKDFMGISASAGPVPPGFLDKLGYLYEHGGDSHLPSVGLALASLALVRLWPASWARVAPPQIAAVAVGTALVAALEAAGVRTGVQTIGSRFGVDAIPRSLPLPHLDLPTLDTVSHLLFPAFTIAVLCAIESLLCCVVADKMIDDRHDPDTELIAQGLANIASASVGGLPATGALARTAANVRSGGRSPLSGVVHSLTVLAVMLVAAPVAQDIPLPVLSAVLVLVALNMGEWGNFGALAGLPEGEAQVFLVAFMLTVLTDVTVAVEAGLVLSALLYLKRVSDATDVTAASTPDGAAAPAGEGVQSLALSGALLFGATASLAAAADQAAASPATRVLLLDCRELIAVDATGLEAVEGAHSKLASAGKHLVLSGLHRQPHAALSTAGLLPVLGFENVVELAGQGRDRARLLAQQAQQPWLAAAR